MITENDYKILKLIQEQGYIKKEKIIEAFPDMEKDINYRLHRVYEHNWFIEEYRPPQDGRFYGGHSDKYTTTPKGNHAIEIYEANKDKEDEANKRSKDALKVSGLAVFVSLLSFLVSLYQACTR